MDTYYNVTEVIKHFISDNRTFPFCLGGTPPPSFIDYSLVAA